MSNGEKIYTHCVGEYEQTDTICNGDEEGISEAEQKPCAWKIRCKNFTEFLKEKGDPIGEYLEAGMNEVKGEEIFYVVPKIGKEKFEKFCDDLISEPEKLEEKDSIKVEEKKGKVKKERKKYKTRKDKKDGRRFGPSKGAKRASRYALSLRVRERRSVLLGMFLEFKKTFIERLNNGRKFVSPGGVVLPGQLYVINRIDTSNYLTIYCKALRGKDVPLLNLRMKTAHLAFDVRFTKTPKELKGLFSKTIFKRLELTPVNDGGGFKSQTKEASKEELSIIAETVARLINKGEIELPPM